MGAEGGGQMQDLVNQSADVQKEDNMEFLKSNLATRRRKESNLPWPFKWPCPKKGPWPMPPGCAEGGGEMQDLVNQSADVQKEDNMEFLKSNLATRRRKESNLPWPFKWPCPKKRPMADATRLC